MAHPRPGDRLARRPMLARRVLRDGSKRMLRTTEGHEMNNLLATPESATSLTECTASDCLFRGGRVHNLFPVVNRHIAAADDISRTKSYNTRDCGPTRQ
jgi:hypothetical protein